MPKMRVGGKKAGGGKMSKMGKTLNSIKSGMKKKSGSMKDLAKNMKPKNTAGKKAGGGKYKIKKK